MTEQLCPCGTKRPYVRCCGPLHRGAAKAENPEQLMRSRYSAFALGNTDYISATWAPETCPSDLELDPAQIWTRLRILETPEVHGDEGYVRFRAHYRYGPERDFLEEYSRFERRYGLWLYVDGEIVSNG